MAMIIAATMNVISESITFFLPPITQVDHHNDVDECQNRKRPAERLVDHVPEVKNLLRARKEQNELSQSRLVTRCADRTFQFAIPRCSQAAQGGQDLAGAERASP